MYARVLSFFLGAEAEPATGQVVEQVLPTIRELDGYRGLVVLSELDGRRVVSLSLWETADAMERSREVTEKIRVAETANRDIESGDPSTFRVVAFDVTR